MSLHGASDFHGKNITQIAFFLLFQPGEVTHWCEDIKFEKLVSKSKSWLKLFN